MRWGWISLLVIVLEVYLWAKAGNQSFVKPFRFHLYAFSVLGLYFASRYVWRRMRQLIRPLPLLAQYPLLAVLLVALSLATITIPLGQLIILTEPPLFLLLGSYLVGAVIFLGGALLGLHVTTFIMRRLMKRRDNNSKIDNGESKDASLRLQSLIALLIMLILCSVGDYNSHNIQIKYLAIPISGLPDNLNGTTIVHLSDIHMGPFIGRSRVESVVKKANALNGDIIVITGDLIDSSVENLWEAAKPLGELKTKLGVYYTTGNHDYYSGDVDSWIEKLPELHVTPLINERRCIQPLMKEGATTEGNGRDESCQNGFYLAGLEDIETRRIRYGHHSMDIHKALSGRTQKIPTVVLAHQPSAAAEAIHWKDVRLVLSGHTHAGQMLPLMLPIYLFNPYFAGLYQPMVGVYVYVSAGTHDYMLHYRHCKPDITLLTLVNV
ncbi:PREDICTED: transmembrane protein with metallophosphoesterase domain-like [Amphimedon queenslandica]|uniref:Calcineurin-like phosphoesterase domain-containing protein n=2 Tax=Amphimedon queenslandica TaxID=400682 RepID=A0AAN0IFJ1_AMPQE|nr:PREDICTED: transmembrane protein with metallophosphoesterase domain-like [Amphimedon queenslandica]|eukprot:XP_003387749.1 PREDICTED: transmembrane protein with metallophosphoesterase domain-like [Amphimedon queenslandica]